MRLQRQSTVMAGEDRGKRERPGRAEESATVHAALSEPRALATAKQASEWVWSCATTLEQKGHWNRRRISLFPGKPECPLYLGVLCSAGPQSEISDLKCVLYLLCMPSPARPAGLGRRGDPAYGEAGSTLPYVSGAVSMADGFSRRVRGSSRATSRAMSPGVTRPAVRRTAAVARSATQIKN